MLPSPYADVVRAALDPSYPGLLRRLVDCGRFPALASALDAGVFEHAVGDPRDGFHARRAQLLDGLAVRM